MAEKQAREMEGANNSGAAVVNRIQKSTSQREHVKPYSKQGMKCYPCGKEGHFGKDLCCPAKRKMCNKCGEIGHLELCVNQNKLITQNINRNIEKANMCIMLQIIQMVNMHSLWKIKNIKVMKLKLK